MTLPRSLPYLAQAMLWLVVPTSSVLAAADAPLLTLEDALALARAQNLQIINANINVDVAVDQTDAMKANQYPELSAGINGFQNFTDNGYTFEEGSLGQVGGNPVPSQNEEINTTDGFTTQYSLTVKQPLLQLYEIGLNVDKLEIEQDIARQQARGARQSATLQVKQLYYQILSSESTIESTEASIAFYTALSKILIDKVAQKTELEYQLLNAEAELASAKHDQMSERNDIVTSKQQLNSLLNRDISTPFSVSLASANPLLHYDPATAADQALANRPETREARLQVEAAKTDVEIQKADYYPDVDLVASYSRLEGTEFIPDESLYVGVIANWQFVTWGQNGAQVSGSLRALTQARNTLQENEEQIRAQVSEYARDLQVAKDLVPVTRLARKAAQEKLRVSFNQYQQDAILLSDLLDAQAELSEANDNYHQAELGVWNASAALENALGEE